MSPRHPRATLAFLTLLIGIAVLSGPAGPGALAQRKGGQKDAKGKEKDAPPPDVTLPNAWVKAFTWRSTGPANRGGRIPPSPSSRPTQVPTGSPPPPAAW